MIVTDKGREPADQQPAAPAGYGFASLKTFRIVTKVRMHPRHATALVRVLLVLTHHQVAHDR
ncbi:hypothetical protein [Streptomyces lacrimifluminis]|uniref:hypothetical protein n=1 Tax=Streptomyces lacrimifluminis TaxID=1500077 RepID=UPI001664A436|nr:hypothetical protein [Streptomyces lacrimifluminis]